MGIPILWFATADRRRARLLACRSTLHKRLHVEEASGLEEKWEEREHGRPSALAGMNGHTYASFHHEEEERIHRFAKEIAHWLEREVQQRDLARIDLFAAPRLLGELRGLLPSALAGRLVEHEGDLNHVSLGELAKHPAIVQLFAERSATLA